MPLFAVTYRYEAAQTEEREANKPSHREWLSEQVRAGTIRSVGPFVDGSGALLLVQAADSRAARELVADDPHCLRGLVPEITVREWLPIFGALA
ncbi:YciI family protein [Rhodococcus sp. IEGM 1408]|uniref:YciI family protein n=1 Tax=Rhodococcus sp. IEGM 1408 TaxID=3082220 RepID=UPI0029552649|nr:YciI family protein [Rhodococcus sp. IEGM 1408]MDV8000406.1 YciI family protein [Rhodococcus sp. IEGM 1408]